MKRGRRLRQSLTILGLLAVPAFGSAPSATGASASVRLPSWSIVVPHHDSENYIDAYDLVTSNHPGVVRTLVRLKPRLDSSSLVGWSPNGTKIAFEDAEERLHVMPVGGGRVGLIRMPGAEVVVWSPDGTRLAYGRFCATREAGCQPGLFVVAASGGPAKRILRQPPNWDGGMWSHPVSWAPDGRSIVCACGGALRVIAADGSGSHLLSVDAVNLGSNVDWSKSGRYIAYEHHCNHESPNVEDPWCRVGIASLSGAKVIQPRPPICAAAEPGGRDLQWTTDDTVLVVPWGCGPPAGTLFSVDPRDGTARRVATAVGGGLTTGPNGTFAMFTGGSVVVADRLGHVLQRQAVPFPKDGPADAEIFLR